MSNKKITDLDSLTTAASGDLIPIVDVSDTTQAVSGSTKKITSSNLLTSLFASPTFTGTATFDSLTATGTVTLTGATIVNSGTLTLPTSTDTIIGRATTDTLTNKTLTAPKFASGGFIADADGNELLIFTTTASAVNEVTLANGDTGVNPKFTASGETNVGLDFQAKGSGVYRLLGTSSQAAELRLYEDTDNGSNYSAIKVGTQSGDITYTLPTAAPAGNGYILTSTTAGEMSWASGTISYAANVTSRAGSTATGTQTIAHGLSSTPRLVVVHATAFDNTESICISHGSYDGTTNSCVYSISVEGGGSAVADLAGHSNANSIMLFDEGGAGGGNGQTATISVDATNITLNWTKVSSGLSSTMYIHWIANT